MELSRLLKRLSDADIDFVIVDGFAAVLYGSSLVTHDLDVCAVLTNDTVEKLRDILGDLHPVHRLTPQKLSFLENPDRGVPMNNLYLQTDWGAVDVLSSIIGVGDFARVRSAAIEVQLFERSCRVISMEDLIRTKESLGRDKDRVAVKELRAIQEKAGTASDSATDSEK